MTIKPDWIKARVTTMQQVDAWKSAVTVTLPIGRETGFVVDVNGKRVIAQFIVWPDGTMEATAGSIADRQVFYVDSASPEDEAALDARWQRFCSEILKWRRTPATCTCNLDLLGGQQ